MQNTAPQPIARLPWNYSNIFWIVLSHLLAIVALFYFSWVNLAVCLFGLYVLAPFGVNVGYHRMLTHRSFETPRWLRYTLVTLGAMLGAGPPLHWAAEHRRHHRHSDTALDPHDSTRGFWHSHVLHLFYFTDGELGERDIIKYAPDLLAEPYLAWLNKYWLWLAVLVLPVLYAAGGIGMVLWGGFMRLVLTWHTMWFVNSASHKWGYRNYPTNDTTVNCWWVGILAAGEGWHNNHHAYPASAAHGHRWWEFDLSYMIIRILVFFGLITGVKLAPSLAPLPAAAASNP